MESTTKGASRAIPIWLLALLVAACGGGSSTPVTGDPATPGGKAVVTNEDGARAAAAAVKTSYGIAPLAVKLADLAATADSELGAVPVTVIPVTISCATRLPILGADSSTPDSATVVRDPFSGKISATFTACRSGARQADGDATVERSGGTSFFTLGSGGIPLIITEFDDAASQAIVGVYKAAGSLSYTPSVSSDSLTMTGWLENRDSVRHTGDRYDLTGMSVVILRSGSVIGSDAYDDYALTVDGAAARTAYVSDIDPAVRFGESSTFAAYGIRYRTPAAGSAAIHDLLGMNGGLGIDTAPAGLCFTGSFAVATVSEIRLVKSSGLTVSGQMAIDANTLASFNGDGSVSVALDGGAPQTFAQADLATLCAI